MCITIINLFTGLQRTIDFINAWSYFYFWKCSAVLFSSLADRFEKQIQELYNIYILYHISKLYIKHKTNIFYYYIFQIFFYLLLWGGFCDSCFLNEVNFIFWILLGFLDLCSGGCFNKPRNILAITFNIHISLLPTLLLIFILCSSLTIYLQGHYFQVPRIRHLQKIHLEQTLPSLHMWENKYKQFITLT